MTLSPDKIEIPEAAVEAAARAIYEWRETAGDQIPMGTLWRELPEESRESYREDGLAAIHGFIPHIPDRGYAEVGVKPLALGPESAMGFYYVDTPFGRYTIMPDMRSKLDGRVIWWFGPQGPEDVKADSATDALSAIQADFETRIRSALIAPPATVSRGYAEGIEAALKIVHATAERMTGCSIDYAAEFIENRLRALVHPAQANATERLANWFNSLPDGGLGKEDFDRLLAIVATPSPIEDVAPSEALPPATPSQAAVGWTLDVDYLDKVRAEMLEATGYDATIECVEFCLLLAARRVRPSPVDEDALVRLQNEQREFARKASVETDPLLKERWSGISVGMRSVLASLQSQRKG